MSVRWCPLLLMQCSILCLEPFITLSSWAWSQSCCHFLLDCILKIHQCFEFESVDARFKKSPTEKSCMRTNLQFFGVWDVTESFLETCDKQQPLHSRNVRDDNNLLEANIFTVVWTTSPQLGCKTVCECNVNFNSVRITDFIIKKVQDDDADNAKCTLKLLQTMSAEVS